MICYKILIFKLLNSKFSINVIILKQIKYQWFKNLSKRILNNKFQFILIKFFFLSNSKLYKLSLLKNQIISQAIQLVLELIYEPRFNNKKLYKCSPFKSHKCLLLYLKLNWTKVSWILTFQIQNFFLNLNLNRLYNILSLKINDKLFLTFIQQFFKTNLKKLFFEHQINFYGIPIILNIYLYSLDLEIIKIKKKFNRFYSNFENIDFKKDKLKKFRILNLLKFGFVLNHKNYSILNISRKLKKNQNFFFQFKYIRYLNFCLFGFYCSKKKIKKIEKQITIFCNSNLKLFILKKKLTHIQSNKIKILNFDIYSKSVTSLKKNKTLIFIQVSLLNIKNYLIKYKLISKSSKPKPALWLIKYSNDLIINWFFSLAKNLLNYYNCCDNFYKIKIYINYVIRYSALFTLALKNKLTINAAIKKWSRSIIIKDQNKNVLAKYINNIY